MNALDESSPASSLRRLPLLVRLAPQLVNRFPALLRSAGSVSSGLTGLLFGHVETDSVFVQAFRPLSSLSASQGKSGSSAGEQDWHDIIVSGSKSEPELADLTLVGWFSARNTAGLLSEDVDFHAKNFRKPTDIVLIIRKEGQREFNVELYCRNHVRELSSKDHLRGAVRLPIDGTLASAVEVPMRLTVHDDLYMRAYAVRNEEDGAMRVWKDALSKTKKAFGRFKPAKFEAEGREHTGTSPERELESQQAANAKGGSLRLQSPAAQPGSSEGPMTVARNAQQDEDKHRSLADRGAAPASAANVANESSPAPNLRRLPFLVRLAPQFLNSLCALLPGSNGGSERLDGVLFGIVETEFSVLRFGRLFPPDLDTESQSSFETFLAESKKDPQIAALSPLGWFSVRNLSGLHTDDIAFHGSKFGKSNDIVLIAKVEPASELTLEIYCRTSDGSFSHDKHRSGSIRISTASPVNLPIEVPIDGKMRGGAVLGNGQTVEEVDEISPAGWKDAFTGKTKKALNFFQSVKPENRDAKDKGVEPSRDSRKPESAMLDRLEAITPALPFPTGRGAAAAAPARIVSDGSGTKPSKDDGKEDFRGGHSSTSPVALPGYEVIQQEAAEQARLQREAAEQAGLQREAAEQARLQQEAAEQARLRQEAAEQARLMREAAEQARLQREAAEQARLQQEAAEQERLQQEAARQELLKREAAQQALRQELLKQERAREEVARQEVARQELLKQEVAKLIPAAQESAAQNSLEPISARSMEKGQVGPASPSQLTAVPTPAVPSNLSDNQLKPASESTLLARQAFPSGPAQYQPKPIRALPWRAMLAVFAVAAAGSFGFVYLKSAGANGRLPGFLQALWPSAGLDLRISTSGDRFQLSWNRALPAVQNAREGTLDIDDGPSHHQIQLGGSELANGSVLLPSDHG